ncbi:hypothetical protein [Accumulibacter sp.]|uniref:hypothetical protein n=1 Tax=Accumulibacter sp. TaxID=2053492 RepID=UPI0025BB6CDE|nr:hypothetical protein [Accumulibacter sp.]
MWLFSIRSAFVSAACLRIAPFSAGVCYFGARAAVTRRQALIERERDVGNGCVVKLVGEDLAIAGVAFAGVVGNSEMLGSDH